MMNNFKFLLTIFFIKFSILTFAAEYYWVGGSGTWSNINSWRTTSGGTVVPNILPGPNDNVYFDNNSFTADSRTITLTADVDAYNLLFIGTDVTKSPIITGLYTLSIYGSTQWQEGMSITVKTIHYKGTNRTIQSNGVQVTGDIIISGTGTTEQNDNISLTGLLTLSGELFKTNNHAINASGITTSWNNTNGNTIALDEFTLGSSILTITNLTIHSDTELTANTSHIQVISNGTLNANNVTLHDVTFNGGMNTTGTIRGTNITFNDVIFKNNSTIYANGHTFNKLTLAPSSYNQLYPLSSYTNTITIKDAFKLQTPECTALATLTNSPSYSNFTTPVTILAESINTSVQVSGSVINLINVGGATTGYASNTTFNQANNGWIINNTPASNLYWVGGAGNWNDSTKWSFTSGGEGGACIPGPYNNTYFNDLSGTDNFTVSFTDNAFTHDINFTGSRIIRFNSNTTKSLNIYGSAKFNPNQVTNYLDLHFKNTSENKTFDPNGLTIQWGDLFLEEEQTITLLSDLTLSNYSIQHYYGTFDLSTTPVTVKMNSYIENETGEPKTLKLGSSKLELTKTDSSISLNKGELTLEPGTSTIEFTNIKNGKASNTGIILSPSQFYNFYNVIFHGFAGINGRIDPTTVNGQTANIFHDVVFNQSSNIYAIGNFNTLKLAQNSIHTLQSYGSSISPIDSKVYIRTSLITDNSECSGWTYLKSAYEDRQGHIILSSTANINIKNFTIEGINISRDDSSNSNINAINSINGGNNDGWNFTEPTINNLYWIGGEGNWTEPIHWALNSGDTPNPNECIPTPLTNTFFDQNSGFGTSSNQLFISGDAFTNDVTFEGNLTPPSVLLSPSVGNDTTFNIYGDSTLQNEMTFNITNLYYRNSNSRNTSRIIKSNTVIYAITNIYLDEENTIGLADGMHIENNGNTSLYLRRGTFNTNNHVLTISAGNLTLNSRSLFSLTLDSYQLPKIINLGNSIVNFNNVGGLFILSISANSTFNTDTSTINIKSRSINNSDTDFFSIPNGTKFYNVNFYAFPRINNNNLIFNDVAFYQNANIIGNNNTFNTMYLSPNFTYRFLSNGTQTVHDLIIGGTPCAYTTIDRYGGSGNNRANLKITEQDRNYNYTNIGNINSLDNPIYFGGQSVDNLNNENILFATPNRDYFPGLGPDWLNHLVKTQDSSTYILDTDYFIPNDFSKYKWYKIDGLNSDPSIIIADTKDYDFRTGGYGTYKAVVEYNDYLNNDICNKDATKIITPAKGFVNPNLRIRTKLPQQ